MLMNEATKIIEMLIHSIYELYPDEEYAELYQVQEKIELAKQFLDKVEVFKHGNKIISA